MDKSVLHYIILTCIGNDVIFFFYRYFNIAIFNYRYFLSTIIADFIADFSSIFINGRISI